jgi:hypothetical protein
LVYKLYDLNEEEIKIVEENIKDNKNWGIFVTNRNWLLYGWISFK